MKENTEAERTIWKKRRAIRITLKTKRKKKITRDKEENKTKKGSYWFCHLRA
jgi:hypothetical protein